MLGKGSQLTENEIYWFRLSEKDTSIKGYQEYAEWKASRSMHQPPSRSDHAHFRWFTYTPGLLEKVISLPFETQHALLEQKVDRVLAPTIVTLLDLLDETQSDYLKAKKWKPYLRAAVPTDPDAPKISPEFEHEFDKFLKFQKNFENTNNKDARVLDSTIVLLLVKKYGEETVCEVMRAWRGNDVTNNVAHLKLIVEQWDILKHLSIDWIMTLLEIKNEE